MLTFTALKVAILMPKLPLEQFPECINMGAKLYSGSPGGTGNSKPDLNSGRAGSVLDSEHWEFKELSIL